jgi:hypothetical protein
MHFRIRGLPAENFAPLFALSDQELAQRGAVRRIADGPRPCRISLTDAQQGDELILVNYEHHPVASPYRMRFAIYVRRGEETFDAVDHVPEQLRKRTLAVRSFDADAMMVSWELAEGAKLADAIARLRRSARGLSACPLRRARLLRRPRGAGVRPFPPNAQDPFCGRGRNLAPPAQIMYESAGEVNHGTCDLQGGAARRRLGLHS